MRLQIYLSAFLFSIVSSALAQSKVAWVIGNAEYESISTLANPMNDAQDIADELENIGFTVQRNFNLTKADTNHAAKKFNRLAEDAEIAVIYYAGHAFQHRGLNYIAATDSQIESPDHVKYDGVPLSHILLAGKGANTLIAFIDACRNNPFTALNPASEENSGKGGYEIVRGLNVLSSDLNALENKFVGMAAANGEVATDDDGGGRNSPFATALIANLSEPIAVGQMFTKVTGHVVKSTQRKQKPHIFASSMTTDVCLVGNCDGQKSIEENAWKTYNNFVKGSTDLSELTRFTVEFEGTQAAEQARLRMAEVVEINNSKTELFAGEQLLADAERHYFSGSQNARTLNMFIQAGENGVAFGYIKAAQILHLGTGVPKDPDLARELALAALPAVEQSASHNPKALYYLGLAQLYGLGTPLNLKEAFASTVLGADAGDPLALNLLGNLYQKGDGVSIDIPKAIVFYEKAAEKGNILAMENLGKIYRDETKDYQKAFEWFRKADNLGGTRAKAFIGYMYDEGLGTPVNDEIARDYYLEPAILGSAWANNNLGALFESGEGGPQDYQQAKTYYEKAIALDPSYKWAPKNMGDLYFLGRGVQPDRDLAIEWYEKASALGNAWGDINIGNIYRGDMSEADLNPELAKEYYQKALDAGEYEGAAKIGWLYDKNILDVDEDARSKLARKYYAMAAENDIAWANNNLGALFESGEGGPQDYQQAKTYYEKAIALDPSYKWAPKNMGDLYFLGRGVQPDRDLAIEWYEKASALGNAWGDINIGNIYRGDMSEADLNPELAKEYYQKALDAGEYEGAAKIGWLYDKNILDVDEDARSKLARKYYAMAAENDIAWANNNLGALFESGEGGPQDYQQAKTYYEKAIALDPSYKWAPKNMGDLYFLGRGVQPDRDLAIEWYEKASALGNAWGDINIGDIYSGDMSEADLNPELAKEYYQKALDAGEFEGAARIGWLYENRVLPSDENSADKNARKYYSLASENNITWAQYNLGNMYLEGRGGDPDLERAIQLYEDAAKAGYQHAAEKLAEIR